MKNLAGAIERLKWRSFTSTIDRIGRIDLCCPAVMRKSEDATAERRRSAS